MKRTLHQIHWGFGLFLLLSGAPALAEPECQPTALVEGQDEPVQLEERFVSPSFAPAYIDQDFETLGMTTTTYLQRIAMPTEVEHVVLAENATAELSRLLQMDDGQAVLKLMRRTWVDEVPVTQSFFSYPSDRYSLGARYRV